MIEQYVALHYNGGELTIMLVTFVSLMLFMIIPFYVNFKFGKNPESDSGFYILCCGTVATILSVLISSSIDEFQPGTCFAQSNFSTELTREDLKERIKKMEIKKNQIEESIKFSKSLNSPSEVGFISDKKKTQYLIDDAKKKLLEKDFTNNIIVADSIGKKYVYSEYGILRENIKAKKQAMFLYPIKVISYPVSLVIAATQLKMPVAKN